MAPGGFGGPGGMQPPPPPGPGGEKEEGPAEEAPEENRPSDLEPLSGYAEQGRRRMQIFELDGYLRLRTDYMHQFFLGQGYTTGPAAASPATSYGLPPFPLPLDCPRARRRRCSLRTDALGVPTTPGPARTRTSAAPTCASGWSRRST